VTVTREGEVFRFRRSVARTIGALAAVAVAFIGVASGRPLPALAAAACTVNSTGDAHNAGNGTCDSTIGAGTVTLRSAIERVNALGGTTTIAFNLPTPSTIQLTNGALSISGGTSVTISGAGIDATIIDANHASRILNSTATTTTLSGLTLRNGQDSTIAAIRSGDLTLTSVKLSGNVVPSGGAAGNDVSGGLVSAGTTTVTDGVITSNTVTATPGSQGSGTLDGGGILAQGHLTLTRTQAFDNSFSGVFVRGGLFFAVAMDVIDTGVSGTSVTIAGNAVGGLMYASDGNVILTGSGIGPNSVGASGNFIVDGGVIDASGTELTNSTVGRNTVTGDSSTTIQGGTIAANSLLSINSTIAGNTASVPTGGNAGTSLATGSTFTLVNTIVDGNTPANCLQPVSSAENSIDSGASCGLGSANGDLSSTDPGVGPMQVDAPGTTPTMALAANSPAVDAGNNSQCPTADQRGVTRIVTGDPVCDIGAYEFRAAVTTPTPTATPTPSPTSTGAAAPTHTATPTPSVNGTIAAPNSGGADHEPPAVVPVMLVLVSLGAALRVWRRRRSGGAEVTL
jgi:hypothetical protein